MLGAALALGAAPAGAQDKKTICFVTFSLQIAYFQSSVAGGKRAAEELGVELVVLDPQADAARQVTLMEDCIARKVNAIVLDPIESGSVMGPINEAGGAGIPIAVLDTPISSPYVVTQVGVPQFDASREFGQFVAGYIIGAMERPGKDRRHAGLDRGAARPPRRLPRGTEGGAERDGGGRGRRPQHP